MPHTFRLFWLRENGCDAGTPLRADELDQQLESPEFSKKALALAGAFSGELTLRLPYLDRREWRNRREILAGLEWERRGNAISPVLPANLALRHTAANLVLSDPRWINAPGAGEAPHANLWQAVSITLQRGFRGWIAEEYFRDIERFADREAAYPMIVYQAARLCHGGSRGSFTYDLRDYPECRHTVAIATKMTGRSIQAILSAIEQRLYAAGMPELARRYSPIWQQDVAIAVRKKPRPFVGLLAAETAFIDGLVELSMNKSHAGVQHFSKIANRALRNVYEMDLRHLGLRAMEEATRVIAGPVEREGPL